MNDLPLVGMQYIYVINLINLYDNTALTLATSDHRNISWPGPCVEHDWPLHPWNKEMRPLTND